MHMEPKTPPMSWEAFCVETKPYSIALDGFVSDGPRFDQAAPRANFNHHEGVSRLETRATCGQVLMAIRQGLLETFRNGDGLRAEVFANDCDEDVCTAWFLLKHGHMAEHAMNPILNRLVALEDMLDATAGTYPLPKDLKVLRELAWIFDPYRRFRLSGELDRKDGRAFEGVVTDVEGRIMRHIVGQGSELPLDMRYERIGGGLSWAMIREVGAQARAGAFADGIRAYVAVRDRPGGGYTYAIGRSSAWVPFNVPKILERMNETEETALEDRWGGGDIVGGSPRVRGSRLDPSEVERIVNEVLLG